MFQILDFTHFNCDMNNNWAFQVKDQKNYLPVKNETEIFIRLKSYIITQNIRKVVYASSELSHRDKLHLNQKKSGLRESEKKISKMCNLKRYKILHGFCQNIPV
jgi:P pilus assembly chaperone PapD